LKVFGPIGAVAVGTTESFSLSYEMSLIKQIPYNNRTLRTLSF